MREEGTHAGGGRCVAPLSGVAPPESGGRTLFSVPPERSAGQYVRTHGVVANGIPLPEDAPSVAAHLRDRAGYRTALIGKAHFEPTFDPQYRYTAARFGQAHRNGIQRGRTGTSCPAPLSYPERHERK